MSLPNLRGIALFVQKLLEVPKSSKLGHVTHAMPTEGSFYGPHAGWVRPPPLYQKLKWIAQFVEKLRGPKIWNLGHVTQVLPIRGRFIIRTQGASVLYVWTKLGLANKLYSFKRFSELRKFEIGSRDPDHAHVWAVLWSTRRRGPSSISASKNWSGLVNSFKGYQGDPKIWKLGPWPTPRRLTGHNPYAGRIRSLSLYQIWRVSFNSLFVQKLLEVPKIPKLGHVTKATPT